MGEPDFADYEKAVRTAAARFRAALDQGDLSLVSLLDFPRGSCGDACELLGQFLVDSGLGQWLYCAGERHEPFQTHAWLERDGLILDITADQFADVTEPVLLTRDRVWHAQYIPMAGARVASLAWFVNGINATEAQRTYIELRRRVDALAGAS